MLFFRLLFRPTGRFSPLSCYHRFSASTLDCLFPFKRKFVEKRKYILFPREILHTPYLLLHRL